MIFPASCRSSVDGRIREGHDSAILNSGLGVQLTPRISTYIGYRGQLGRDPFYSNGVTGAFSFSF
jgi:hypothetical protein